MNTDVKSIATGDFVYFFREGDAFTLPTPGGTVSRTAQIPSTDPLDEGWLVRKIGNVESLEPKLVDDDEVKVMGPAGETGLITTRDVVQVKQGLEFDFTTNEMTRLAAQCFYRTQNLSNASTYFNPLSSVPPKGWLLVQRYDQEGQEHVIFLAWARLKCTGGMKSGDGSLIKPTWNALVLWDYSNIASI
jgi:hypothetical protein